MTWPTEQAREAVEDAAYDFLPTTAYPAFADAVLDALAPHVAALVRAERAAAWDEGYDVGHRHARRVLPPDESDANPYAEEADR